MVAPYISSTDMLTRTKRLSMDPYIEMPLGVQDMSGVWDRRDFPARRGAEERENRLLSHLRRSLAIIMVKK
jgi:hypothetical protein